MRAASSLLPVLLVEDDAADAEIVGRFVALAAPETYDLRRAKTVHEALETLRDEAFALILLDLRLPDSIENQTFAEIHGAAPDTPVVVLTGMGDEVDGARRVREGAQDYLVKGRFDAHLLARVMRYAIDRHGLVAEVAALRERERRDAELHALQALAQASTLDRKTPPLRQAAPALFADLERRFRGLLEVALDRSIYKQDKSGLGDALGVVVDDLIRADAGPKEVVEIYSSALKSELGAQTNEARGHALLEEGRLVVLEVMGALVKGYRQQAKGRQCP
jgi:CheY-like chemotaxis protein